MWPRDPFDNPDPPSRLGAIADRDVADRRGDRDIDRTRAMDIGFDADWPWTGTIYRHPRGGTIASRTSRLNVRIRAYMRGQRRLANPNRTAQQAASRLCRRIAWVAGHHRLVGSLSPWQLGTPQYPMRFDKAALLTGKIGRDQSADRGLRRHVEMTFAHLFIAGIVFECARDVRLGKTSADQGFMRTG